MDTQASSIVPAVAQTIQTDEEMAVVEASPAQTPSEDMEAATPTPVSDSIVSTQEQMALTPAVDNVVESVPGPSAPAPPERSARISPKKAQQAAIVAARPPPTEIKVEEIDCPMMKWPAALLMQNVEEFLVNTAQREMWLASRRKAAAKELKVDNYKPERSYNSVTPVMPTPKERKRLKEFRES